MMIRMRTRLILSSLLAAAAWGQSANSPFPVTQGKVYKFEKAGDGIYYATGGPGSNNVVIVNDQDVFLVDDGTTPAAARALLADIKLLTPKPVRQVVNTHFHYDHTAGNQVFGPDVQIIGHQFVRTAIMTFDILHREPYMTSQGNRVPALIDSLTKQISVEKDAAKKAGVQKQLVSAQAELRDLKEIKPAPPNVTYDSKLTIEKGSREIQLLFLGRGHTGGDTFVYLPKEKIICTGDEEEGARVAYMGDAYFDEWVTTLDRLKQLDFTLVLPGHGVPFRDKAVITAFQSYLKDLVAKGAALKKLGVSADDAAKKIDMRSHANDFPAITGPGVEPRGMRRLYAWLDETGRK
jgi:glyoxylase-like metal-dependent hydrolase (beta-lactamase superfamily II)